MNKNEITEELKVGDKVRVKSTSQTMEIIEIKEDNAKCFWTYKGKPKFKYFPISLLVKVKPIPPMFPL